MLLAAICFSPTLGGLELATLRRASEMIGLGHRAVAILAAGSTELAARARDMGLEVVTIRIRLPYLDLLAGRALRKLIKQRDIDLLLVARSKDLSTAMLGATDDTAVVLYHQMQSDVVKIDWFHNPIYRRLDGAIIITERQRAQLLRTTGLVPSKIHFAAYGVDNRRFSPDAITTSEARRLFGIADSAFVVGIVGGFAVGKGHHHLLNGLRIAAERDPQLSESLWGLFVGERSGDTGPYTTELRSIRDAIPFAERIVFSPFLDNPAAAYRAMDVFVLASHSETFGMVVQEAMSSGCAVVATNAGGVPEIITSETNGILVPPMSPEAIAEAVLRLWHDPQLRQRLADAGRKTCLERYDPKRATERFASILGQTVERRRSASVE